jgi:hypothetical protein
MQVYKLEFNYSSLECKLIEERTTISTDTRLRMESLTTVLLDELSEGQDLDCEVLIRLSGDDKVNARYFYCNHIKSKL